jgi:hypothetical protein
MTENSSDIPAAAMLYPLRTSLGMQLAGMVRSQICADGQHQNHWMPTLTLITRLTEIMTNHTDTLVQPSEMRSKVTANEVLLHTAARIKKKPAVCETSLLATS